MCNEFFEKFPAFLRDKLINGELSFPCYTQYEYEPILAYRCIERKKNDYNEVCESDFYPNIISNKKKHRGQSKKDNDINNYGTSLYTERKALDNNMYLPRPTKKVCKGFVFEEGGPQKTDGNHVNWWIFDNVDFSGFTIEKEELNHE